VLSDERDISRQSKGLLKSATLLATQPHERSKNRAELFVCIISCIVILCIGEAA
jgi:hypothetical protein